MESWPDSSYTPFRGSKGTTWEGGVRVPGIFYWKGMIEAGRVSDGLFDFCDVLPTFCALAGVEDLPEDRFLDGVDQRGFLLADTPRGRTYWAAGPGVDLQPAGRVLLAAGPVLGDPGGRLQDVRQRPRRSTSTTP